jgi:hypothetical protein
LILEYLFVIRNEKEGRGFVGSDRKEARAGWPGVVKEALFVICLGCREFGGKHGDTKVSLCDPRTLITPGLYIMVKKSHLLDPHLDHSLVTTIIHDGVD